MDNQHFLYLNKRFFNLVSLIFIISEWISKTLTEYIKTVALLFPAEKSMVLNRSASIEYLYLLKYPSYE